ncbi:MAG: YqaA family protein [Candidatus Saccharimonadales bacterium]
MAKDQEEIKNIEDIEKKTLFLRMITWPSRSIRRVYAWMMKWGDSPQAEKALFGFSFIESSFFPIPPDPLLITMVIANVKKWFRFALITTIASVIGAGLGYLIGFGAFETIGRSIVDFYNLEEEFKFVGEQYEQNAFWTILIAGFTPIPYKVFTIASGVFTINIITLLVASLIGRGGRFIIVAFLAKTLGARYKDKIERYIDVLGLLFLGLIIAGFVVIKYII